MPSAFVTEQLEALVSTFGLPQTDTPLVVSKVTPEFGGRTAGDVRPNHALRAARQIRLSDTWLLDSGGYRLMVGLSDITLTQQPHSLISVVHAPADKEAWVESAWRTPEITDLTPTEALLDLIERCGLPITVGGGSPALFVAEAVTAPQAVAAVAVPSGAARLGVFVRSAPDGWHTSWVYAIDTGKYLSSTQSS